MSLLIKVTAIVVLLVASWFMVIEPTMECYAVNGTPVRGLFMIECIP